MCSSYNTLYHNRTCELKWENPCRSEPTLLLLNLYSRLFCFFTVSWNLAENSKSWKQREETVKRMSFPLITAPHIAFIEDWQSENIMIRNQNSITVSSWRKKKIHRRTAVWHAEWPISAGTRTRSLWIRSPARYSIAPQRPRHRIFDQKRVYTPPSPRSIPQHPLSIRTAVLRQFPCRPLGGAASAPPLVSSTATVSVHAGHLLKA